MSSLYSIGAMNQLGDSLENSGFSPEDITKLKQFENLKGVRDLLYGKAEITYPGRAWREQDGVIRSSVTSDGTTGPDWIVRLEKKGYRLSDYAKSLLRSKDFQPTNGVTTEIAVLKGMLFSDSDRITKKIRADADKRNLAKPNAEVACLIREKLSDEELEAMGLYWIVVMHEPIKDSDGDPNLLNSNRDDDGQWLYAYYDEPDGRFNRENGFAFAVSQVSSQN
jgi:hypothetical protein